MKRLFPTMIDRPEPRILVSGIPYWVIAFFLLPFMMALFSQDSGQILYGAWLDMGYHLLNFLVVLVCFFPYLQESFLNVELNPKKFFKTVFWGTAMVVALKTLIPMLAQKSASDLWLDVALGHLVTTESDITHSATALIEAQPLWGTLCAVLLTPLVTSCLLYACAFAPICNNRPWLAYVVMTAALLAIHLMMIISLWSSDYEIASFLVQLPIHLVACWTYQYTDTVWTPIAVHSISNLLLSLLTLNYLNIF